MQKIKTKKIRSLRPAFVDILNLKFYILICIFVFCILNSTFFCLAEDKIVAIVNNEIITQKDLDDFMNFMYIQLSAKYKDKELENKVYELKPDLLSRLIEDRLILQQAKKDNIFIDETRVKARINEIKSHYPYEAEFQNALIKQGLTQADMELKIREQLLIFNMIDTQIRNRIVINPKEVTDFYEAAAQDFIEPETRKVNSLVMKTEDLVNKVLASLNGGSDFEKITQDYPVELNNLGLVKKGQLIKEIEDVIFNLDSGKVSKPIKIGELYYIFKIEEILPVRKYTLSEVQDEIYNRLYELKMQEKLTEWLDSLKQKSYVEIKKN